MAEGRRREGLRERKGMDGWTGKRGEVGRIGEGCVIRGLREAEIYAFPVTRHINMLTGQNSLQFTVIIV